MYAGTVIRAFFVSRREMPVSRRTYPKNIFLTDLLPRLLPVGYRRQRMPGYLDGAFRYAGFMPAERFFTEIKKGTDCRPFP